MTEVVRKFPAIYAMWITPVNLILKLFHIFIDHSLRDMLKYMLEPFTSRSPHLTTSLDYKCHHYVIFPIPFLKGARAVFIFVESTPSLGPSQPPLFNEHHVKWPWHEANQSPPFSPEDENGWSYISPLPC